MFREKIKPDARKIASSMERGENREGSQRRQLKGSRRILQTWALKEEREAEGLKQKVQHEQRPRTVVVEGC